MESSPPAHPQPGGHAPSLPLSPSPPNLGAYNLAWPAALPHNLAWPAVLPHNLAWPAAPFPHPMAPAVPLPSGPPHSFSFQSLLHGVGMGSVKPFYFANAVEQQDRFVSQPSIALDSENSQCDTIASADQAEAPMHTDTGFEAEVPAHSAAVEPDLMFHEPLEVEVDSIESGRDACIEDAEDEESSDEESSDEEAAGDGENAHLKYEISTTVLGDCGCASNGTTYAKRKRWGKGVKPPDCRLPRDMGNIEKAMRNSQNRTTEHIFEPVLGMVFDSKNEAYEFYNLYSWEVGFGVRYGSSSDNRASGYRTLQEIVCEKEGFDKRCTNSSKRDRCKAMLRLHRTEDHGWYVSQHAKEHNHPLSVSCGEKREWNSHGKIEQCTKDMIRYLRENNVTLSRVHCIMGSMYGGMENVPFNQKRLRAVCAQIARDHKDEDWYKTLQIFKKMRAEDPGFQFAADFDQDKKVKTLIWASGKSRNDYNFFGDAITFDTTYCTNLYKMPFGMFVGVNNHFQSILFAGVLMRDEKTTSFEWVFNEFLTLMGGKAPVTVLTDQCKAMTKAIKKVMPESNHLWCKWHVLKTAPEELGPLYGDKSPFRRDFHYVINEMLTVDEFERGWAYLLNTYNLHEHPFMKKTYKKRKKWAKAWCKGKFCARMTSTQRSESANSMLKKFVPRNSAMNRFVEQYRKLLYIRASAEYKAEHKTKQFKDRSKRVEPVEKHAFTVYTHKVFLMFREETNKCTDYNVVQGASNTDFTVIHNNAEKRKEWSRVAFNVTVSDDGERYSCECGLFEHFGMLCCHAIKVLIHRGVNKIPEAHVVKRWTREARDIVYPESGAPVADQLMCNLLYINALETVRIAGSDPEAREILMNHLKSAKKDLDKHFERRSKEQISTSTSSDEGYMTDSIGGNVYGAGGSCAYMSDVDIENMEVPAVVRKKGRPKCNRYKTGFEMHANKKRKKGGGKQSERKKPASKKGKKAGASVQEGRPK